MKKIYILKILLFLALFFSSCGSDDSEYKEVSPVVMDLTAVPYPKLSDYKFFVGEMKNLEPAYKVLPYDLNSELFTDYALKKRFVWMPEGTKATYTEDGEVLDLPVGAVLIKNFYYENINPGGGTKIIETRLMIRKESGWVFANYIWNSDKSDALLDMDGSETRVVWDLDGETRNIIYNIPSENDCRWCHALNEQVTPIGIKPQNLNKDFQYNNGSMNQLARWKQEGYLNTVPSSVNSTIDWKEENQPLELRVRSYLDINCAHCHRPGNWEHPSINLQFNETSDPLNLGVCVEPMDFVSGPQTYIVTKQDPFLSLMHFRMNTNTQADRMPAIGRTIIHEEGVQLIEDWINSLDGNCP